MVSTKKVCRCVYTLLVEAIPTRFYWLTRRKQKLVQSKALQQRLFVLILEFWQYSQIFVHYLMSILTTCKKTGGSIYPVAPWRIPFATICSEKEETEKFPFYRNK